MEVDQPDNPSPVIRSKPYQLIAQKVELDISFDKFVTGRTQLTIFPEYPEVPGILLNARQCQIKKITVNGHATSAALYNDPCDVLNLHTRPSVRKSHVLSEKLAAYVSYPAEPELFIPLPEGVSIEETVNVIASVDAASKSLDVSGLQGNDAEIADNVIGAAVSKYTPLEVIIEFVSLHTRDALQFAVGAPGSGRWPHVFTKGGFLPGRTSSIFPCMDSVYHRCPWEISLTAARTVGDALKEITGQMTVESSEEAKAYEAKEMVFVCPGDVTDDFVSKTDHSRRTVSYAITSNVSAQQIGFAIGPFEKVDLTKLRESDKVELLQDNAAQISAYCLPGRAAETENTCLATVEALDHFVITQEPFPFSSFSYCFVDDQVDRPATFAGLSVCSSRMLYPDNIIDPAQEVTRTLIQVLASQWMGMQIIPKQPEDAWVVLGSALFLAELFMKELCGNNEYRFRMKRMSDRVCEMDHQRPAIWDMGALLHIDPAEYEFLALKAPLVLYILDRRIHKETGKATMSNTIQKFLTKARYETLKDNMMSTQDFCKAIEKTLHAPIDDFINQWVKGAGCPHFVASQRFNKKKLVIEMTIQQVQANDASDPTLDPDTFMRDVREEFGNVYAASPQHVFTGPMTIRIHEADGSPYEHIIQIKEAVTKVEVPYTTKYKRLKRSKKQRAKNSARTEGDDEQEAVVYTLGDVLQSEEEIAAWRISEWSEEEEQKMNSESYEWIRLDADFEWIAGLRLQMPGHMFQSQLQQDRDVTAQLVSIKHLELYQAGRLISSILVRTMMDARYFHGIRTAAAQALVKNASNRNNADMIGLFHLTKAFNELYCVSDGDSVMPRPNDFSDQQAYLLQGALVDAISRIRSDEGYTPLEVKQFLLDKLRFNDNSSNSYSDAHYVAKLLKALTRAIVARPPRPDEADLQDDLDEAQRWADLEGFERSCLGEIDRYRRMDEWTSSYQNLYSRTALECQSTLIQHGVAKFSAAHFFQYIRPTNYEMLRLTAYEILTNIFLYKDDGILQKVVHGMVANNSPYVRDRIKNAFGKALARRAIGLGRPAQAAPAGTAAAESMVVSDGVVPVPVLDTARLSNVEAALDALKKELAGNAVLERTLQQMLTYPEVGFEDISAVNDFCRMIYPIQDEAKMTLRLPRYWKIEKVGKGRFKFSRTQKTRRKQIKPWKPRALPIVFPKTITEPQKKGSTMLKLKMNSQSRQNSISVPAPVLKPIATPTPPTEPPKTTLKLKFGARPSQ